MKQIQPFISVIVTTYNRPKQLESCLHALVHQIYSRDSFEVIVVDDGSKISLEGVLSPFQEQINLTVLKQANAGPAAGRNTGALHAKGDFLAFTDDDCSPCEEWLSEFAAQFEKNPECVIGGKIVYDWSDSIYATTRQMIHDIVYQHYNKDYSNARFFPTCNMAVPADKFLELGGFDLNFRTSEDREFCDRWLNAGHQMRYVPEAAIYHDDNLTSFASFCKRYFDYGCGAYNFHKIRSLRSSGSMQEEMKFHATLPNWLSHPFRQDKFTWACISACLLLAWQVSNVAGFFYEMLRIKISSNRQAMEEYNSD